MGLSRLLKMTKNIWENWSLGVRYLERFFPKKRALDKQQYLFVIRSYKYRTSPALPGAEAPESASKVIYICEKYKI